MRPVTTTLEALKLGRVRQQTQPDSLAFDAVRIADFAAENLQTAADRKRRLVG